MHSFSKSEFNGSRLVANLDRGHADIGIVPPVDSGPSFAPAGAVSFGAHGIRILGANRIDAAVCSVWW